MKISQAVALRIKELLKQRNMTLYKLEKESGVLHGTMSNIMYGRNKGVTLTVVIQISFWILVLVVVKINFLF